MSIDIHSSLATLYRETGDGEQPRSAIVYQPDSVEDETWQWSTFSVSVGCLPANSTQISIKYSRWFSRWWWIWLGLFIHLDSDVKSLRLIRSAL